MNKKKSTERLSQLKVNNNVKLEVYIRIHVTGAPKITNHLKSEENVKATIKRSTVLIKSK